MWEACPASHFLRYKLQQVLLAMPTLFPSLTFLVWRDNFNGPNIERNIRRNVGPNIGDADTEQYNQTIRNWNNLEILADNRSRLISICTRLLASSACTRLTRLKITLNDDNSRSR